MKLLRTISYDFEFYILKMLEKKKGGNISLSGNHTSSLYV